MARKKEETRWDYIGCGEWLRLYGDKTVMTDLVMAVFASLYRSGGSGSAKNIALAFHMDYRALNAGVGWAGSKLRERFGAWADSGGSRSPWEYVFDGRETEDGTYLWILKPSAAVAWREMMDADLSATGDIKEILRDDESADGLERSLFSVPPEETVRRIREQLRKRKVFWRRSLPKHPCCAVCGTDRLSLLQAVPYGGDGMEQKGLLFCPTHGALFAARLISFTDKGKLIISKRLSEKERVCCGLEEGAQVKSRFSRRRMAEHRSRFNEEDQEEEHI